MSIFWKWFFTNISRAVRARAKILMKINPLGHKHTPPHLFPAKNVILSKSCHGLPKFGHFSMKKHQEMLVFGPSFWKHSRFFFHFYVILVDIQPISAKLDPSKIYWNTPLHPAYLPSHIHCGHIPLFRMVSEEIALQFAVTHGRTDGRELVNIEIDIWETA